MAMCSISHAQKSIDELLYNQIVEIVENNIESDASNADYNTFLENLEYYALHPLNLNTVDRETLELLGLLTEIEIQMLLSYRARLGEFVEVRELILAGLDKRKVDVLDLFFDLKNVEITNLVKNRKQVFKDFNHQLFLRYQRVLENKEGYLNDKYQGDANKYYLRYSVNYQHQLQAGFVLEKDDGESFYTKDNKANLAQPLQGFDYRNAYFSIRSKSVFKQIIVGSYNIQLGQGLSSWSGFGFGKSIYVLQSKKVGKMLSPYTSVNENGFYKGIATVLKAKKWVILPYLSSKKIDANATLLDSSTYKPTIVSSIQKTGYHRTLNEIEDEKSIRETVVGLSVGRVFNELQLRANYQLVNYSASIEEPQQLYQKHNFTGKKSQNIGLDYKYRKGKLSFYGETVLQSKRKSAHLIGLNFYMHSKLAAVLLYRNYDAGYYAPYANGFSENSTTANEQGVYLGLEYKPSSKWAIATYVDSYKKPWLAFGASAPSDGTDFLIQINHIRDKYLEQYIRIKYEVKETNSDVDSRINYLVDQVKWRGRYHLSYEVNSKVKIRSRFEVSALHQESVRQYGMLLYQDLKLKLFDYKLDFTSRVAYFDTPNFETAIYAYENDVLYSFSVPGYYNSGMRYYALLAFDVFKNTRAWVRYARWIYSDVDSISSGDSEIIGDTKSEIKIQLRIQF